MGNSPPGQESESRPSSGILHRGVISSLTLLKTAANQRATFVEPGAVIRELVSETTHAMLDLFLSPADWADDVASVLRVREACIASDHFLVHCRIQGDYEKLQKAAQTKRRHLEALVQPDKRQRKVFADHYSFVEVADADVNKQ